MKRVNRNVLNLLFFVLVLAGGLTSCNNSTIYNESQKMENSTWMSIDTIKAVVEVTDTTKYHTIFMDTRLNATYPYSNMYLKSIVVGPTGQKISEVKNFEITDKAGKWLGGGYGDLHSYGLPLYERMEFKQQGKYQIKVIPYMRKDSLVGVNDCGIRVTIGKEIF